MGRWAEEGRARAASAFGLVLALLAASPALAAPGDLDPTFADHGTWFRDLASVGYESFSAILVRPDGRLILGGASYDEAAKSGVGALVQLEQDGSLDASFGEQGIVRTTFGGRMTSFGPVALQPDGKVVVTGAGNPSDFFVARFSSDGSPDQSFGAGGIATVSAEPSRATATAAALQPDGRIVATGSLCDDQCAFATIRLLQDGSLDTSFGTNGIALTPIGSAAYAWSVRIRPDGKIVVVGESTTVADGMAFTLAQYTSDGHLDTSFGSQGTVRTLFPNGPYVSNAYARSAVLQPDGKILALGSSVELSGQTSASSSTLVRYRQDGSLDPAFGTSGIVKTIVGSNSYGYAIALQDDGRIVTTLEPSSEQGRRFALLRYRSDGTLDPEFGIDGVVTTAIGVDDVADAVTVQPDGKIVAAGASIVGEVNSALVAARYVGGRSLCGNGVLDAGESCDDGNLLNGDCCSSHCTIEPVTIVCRPSSGACDPAETCDGVTASCPSDGVAPATTICRAASSECDVAEHCSGSGGACPADAFTASGTTCSDDGNVCTADVCDGAGRCTHPNNTAPCDDGLFCNGADSCSAGRCSVHAGDPCLDGAECRATCSEARRSCNADAGTPCSDDGSVCTADACDGDGSCAHPAAHAGVVCRPSAGDCDVAETCDGIAPACPVDHFRSPSTVCRAATGECDVAESCSGASAQCPLDAHVAAGTACTPDGAICTADVCDGGGACTHPAGNAGVTCRAAAGDCDVAEQCDGSSVTCPSDRLQPTTLVCRGAAGECDLAERCSGTSPSCPTDVRAPAGTSCTPDAEICTADVCDGNDVACTHPAGNAGVECRAATDVCDLAETCDGTSTSCPADSALADSDADGTCDAQDPCTNVGGTQDFTSPPASSVVLAGVGSDGRPDNDKLKLVAFFDLPAGRTFADLRPHLDGARVSISGSDASTALDVTLPAGAYGPATRHGWLPTGAGKGWTFVDRRPAPANGIVKLVVSNVGRAATPRRVKVVVTGKNGAYPVRAASAPIRASIALGNAADAAAGLCGESAYAARDCAFNRAGTQLVCKR